MSKSCTKCGIEKGLDQYHKDPRNRDGRQGQCSQCRNAVSVAWQRRNRDRTRAASNRWKARNPEMVKAYSKRHWAKNKEREYARVRAYMRANGGERESYYNHLRESRRRGAKGHCSLEQLQARIAFYGWRCWLCGCDWLALNPEDQTVDHVIPLARGGSAWPSNLRPACRSCNSSKGSGLV